MTRVLIYRLGSLGDTVMALPALHLVRRQFDGAEIRVLTDFNSNTKAPAMATVLGESGLVDGYFEYPLGTRSPADILAVARAVRRWGPDVAVYLAAPRGRGKAWRDVAFLKACGASRVIGAPLTDDLQAYRFDPAVGLWESEAARLGRCLAPLGDCALNDRDSWDLGLSGDELGAGHRAVAGLNGFLTISPGGKSAVQDWGEDRWQQALALLADKLPEMGLLAVGAREEAERCDRLLAGWQGPTINLCGTVAPRVAAAAMRRGAAFLGHDSGPMHLAAAVGLPCTGIFSSRARKGMWFPPGDHHRWFYTDIGCAGCGLLTCDARGKACINAIEPAAVADSVARSIARHGGHAELVGAA